MKDRANRDVVRCAVGTKLNCIGYNHISSEGGIAETDIWSWPNEISAPELLDIRNEVRDKVDQANARLAEELDTVVAHTDVDLTIYDPEVKDSSGNPIRAIRIEETNLGDLCADAYRDQAGADVAIINGGGIRASIDRGDITFGDLIRVQPFGNELCVIEVTGRQILDALEWGSRAIPAENAAFLHVSGLTYEIHSEVPSPCVGDASGMFLRTEGPSRVQNVMVGGQPLDLGKTYTLAGHNFMLLDSGDGYTMFSGAPLLLDRVKQDNQVLIDYITDTLGGAIGSEYADPYGQGRIVIVE